MQAPPLFFLFIKNLQIKAIDGLLSFMILSQRGCLLSHASLMYICFFPPGFRVLHTNRKPHKKGYVTTSKIAKCIRADSPVYSIRAFFSLIPFLPSKTFFFRLPWLVCLLACDQESESIFQQTGKGHFVEACLPFLPPAPPSQTNPFFSRPHASAT